MSNPMGNIRKGEPARSEIAALWQTASGLQAADGLSTSDFLRQTSQKHIDGKISLEQVGEQLYRYYYERNTHDAGDPEKEDADKVAVNIVRILLFDNTLDYSTEGLASLHRRIFEGVYENAGVLRQVEMSKREWVLGGDTVSFTSFESLPDSLAHCIAKERGYQYETASSDELISHLSGFVSELWKLCPFSEGNTRFIAVLTLLYLRHLGICIKIDTFKNDSWYFHNALVRANFRDLVKNIDYEPIYLERFFRNLLLGEQWDLRNRYLHVRPAAEWSVQTNLSKETSAGQVQLKKEPSKVLEEEKKSVSKDKVKEGEISIIREKEVLIRADQEENLLDNPNICFLAVVIGDGFLSVKEMMDGLQLKGRDNFLKLYLTPAVNSGLVSLLYPNSPRHPRQKYLLTSKGLDFLKSIGPEMTARIQRHLNKIKSIDVDFDFDTLAR